MKRLLMAGAAITLTGAAAFALDDDRGERTRVHLVAQDNTVIMGDDGQIVEIRGANGDRTIHIDNDGERSVINIDGQAIEIVDGVVTVDGETVDVSPHSVVIIDGDEVRVVEGRQARMGRSFELHLAERMEHLAEMENHMADMVIDLDVDHAGIEAEVMRSLEHALAGLDDHHVMRSSDWDDLSDEEQEEVRAELRAARDEMREAMEEARIELRESQVEMEGQRRIARIEIQRAARDLAQAEREIARARVEVLRSDAEGRRERVEIRRHDVEARRGDMEGRRADVERLHQLLGDNGAGEIRLEETDGRQRVWIDGEEQSGDDLVEWLNRLEVDRLSGGRHEGRELRQHTRVERIQFGDSDRIIEMDDGERVVILELQSTDDDDD